MKNTVRADFYSYKNQPGKHLLKIMKVTAFLLFFCVFSMMASNANSQTTKVSIVKNNATLLEILNEIESQTHYLFMYSDDISVQQKVSVHMENKTVAEVLDAILGNHISYEMEGNHIVLSYNQDTNKVQQEKGTIIVKGHVADMTGLPIIGANILEKGVAGNGVVSDIDGNFSFQVQRGATLVVTYIGYTNQEIKAEAGKTLQIVMEEDAQTLSEVVVMGYTIQSRNTLTGSAVALKESKLKDVATANISTMLEGKVAGMNVQLESGKPGQTAKISIRGKGSLGSSLDPIWVVDGVIFNSDPRLSPNEIDNVTVLKDAASTALYGSRASNGVIVVTTKRGGTDRQKFNVNIQQGLSTLSWGNLKMMNSQQLYDYQSSFNSSSWFNENLLKHDTDWMDLATQTGLYTNINASYQGGNEKLNSYVLLDYYRETAAVKEMEYDRYTIRSNTDFKIHDRFKAFLNMQGQYVKTKDQTASLYSSYLYLPWDYPYNEDGSVRTGQESDWYGRDSENYLESQYKDWSGYENFYVAATAGFKWELWKGVTLESNNNVNYKIARDESYVDPDTQGGQSKHGTISNTYSITSNYFTNQMLRYKTEINNMHSLQALVAYEFSRYYYQATSATAKGITSGKEVIDGTTGMDDMSGSKSAFDIQSILSNVNYAYDNKYMLQVSYRLDGSSKFGKNNQYGNFYTVSGGWNFSREKFFEPLTSVVKDAKLRLSYGVVGNTPDGNYNHLSLYTSDMYNELPANFPDQLGNDDLSWEKTKTFDIGLDINLIDRVRFSIDYYNKNTSDLLYYVKLSTISGYGGQWQNIGAVINKGVDLSLDANLFHNNDWDWTFGFNLGHNKNRIKELYGGRPQLTGIRRFEEGRDMDDIYLAEWAGVDPETGAPQWYKTDENGKRVLTSSYTEAQASRVYMGSAAPKVNGGFNTSLTWKNLTLNANFVYSVGGKLYATGRELLDSDGAYDTYNQMVLKKGWKRWEKPGDIATHPQAISGGNANSNKTSSRYLEDADYLTFKNLTLSYSVPRKALSWLKASDVTLSFSADNLFTVTPYSQVDPATAGYDGTGYGSSTTYPTTRKYIFGINVSF